ncbi:MAG TPA: saccharopine dehydrogenase NADP-binding domain-containing protein, partial [Phycicoccus sp.]
MTAPERELDLVLFGATGFVGRLTAHHLAEHAPPGVRIGLAARSRPRLEALAAELGDTAAAWPLLVVDAADEAAVAGLAARTRVVATTVGPYARYGVPLVAACAA